MRLQELNSSFFNLTNSVTLFLCTFQLSFTSLQNDLCTQPSQTAWLGVTLKLWNWKILSVRDSQILPVEACMYLARLVLGKRLSYNMWSKISRYILLEMLHFSIRFWSFSLKSSIIALITASHKRYFSCRGPHGVNDLTPWPSCHLRTRGWYWLLP